MVYPDGPDVYVQVTCPHSVLRRLEDEKTGASDEWSAVVLAHAGAKFNNRSQADAYIEKLFQGQSFECIETNHRRMIDFLMHMFRIYYIGRNLQESIIPSQTDPGFRSLPEP